MTNSRPEDRSLGIDCDSIFNYRSCKLTIILITDYRLAKVLKFVFAPINCNRKLFSYFCKVERCNCKSTG